MKKTFEIPTIEKMDFVLSDKTMCANELSANLMSDYRQFDQISQSAFGNMTEQ